jgi:hypothetical protein
VPQDITDICSLCLFIEGCLSNIIANESEKKKKKKKREMKDNKTYNL